MILDAHNDKRTAAFNFPQNTFRPNSSALRHFRYVPPTPIYRRRSNVAVTYRRNDDVRLYYTLIISYIMKRILFSKVKIMSKTTLVIQIGGISIEIHVKKCTVYTNSVRVTL